MNSEEFLKDLNNFRTALCPMGEAPGFAPAEVLSAYAYFQSVVDRDRQVSLQEEYTQALKDKVKKGSSVDHDPNNISVDI